MKVKSRFMRMRGWVWLSIVALSLGAGRSAIFADAAKPAASSASDSEEARAKAKAAEDAEVAKLRTVVPGTLVGRVAGSGSLPQHVTYSPDGARVAYTLRQGGQMCVVFISERITTEDELFRRVGPPVWSASGLQLAYVAYRPIPKKVIGLEQHRDALGQSFGQIDASVFSAKDVATAKEPLQPFLVLITQKDAKSTQLEWRIFSPVGTEAAYRAGKSKQGPVKEFTNLADAPLSLVPPAPLDRSQLDLVGSPVLSPDGARLAIETALPDQERVVLVIRTDGKAVSYGPIVTSIRELGFSPDGRHLAYIANRNGKDIVIVNDQLSTPFDHVHTGLRFSEDGKSLMFGAQLDQDLWWVVLPVR